MGVGDVGDPVADRRRDGLLERARPGVDGLDLRAHQPHPLDVGLLAAHVLGAHVDDALDAEQRARGRGRDAVLAGAGLGDDARLAHPHGEQALAERVVDLVGAGVEQVLALEVHGVADLVREALRVVERRRAPGEVAQQRAQLRLEVRVLARRDPGGLELGQRRHQRLRHVLAAVGAEAMLDGTLAQGARFPSGVRPGAKPALMRPPARARPSTGTPRAWPGP